jgi:predicted nucleic acid-binding Zn ribbon protein
MTNSHSTPQRPCAQCGAPVARKLTDARFCSVKCGTDFRNLRAKRGAILYDLWMTNRHERRLAKTLKVLHVMTRLAMYWFESDQKRKTWNSATATIDRVSWANATVVHRLR